MPQPPSSDSKPPGIGQLINQAKSEHSTSSTPKFKMTGSKKDGWGGFKSYLGKKNFKQFLAGISKYVANEMKREDKETAAAARRLKASQEGKPDPD